MQKAVDDWFFHHPMLLQMRGYKLDNPLQTQAALQAYLDLTEVKQWHRVTVHPCHSHRMVYLRVQQHEQDELGCVLPLSATTELSLASLTAYFQAINQCEARDNQHEVPRLTLALVDSDSTIVYYYIFQGFDPPTSSLTEAPNIVYTGLP